MAHSVSGGPTTLCDIEAGGFRRLATGEADIGAEHGRPGAGAHSRHFNIILDVVGEELLGCARNEPRVYPRTRVAVVMLLMHHFPLSRFPSYPLFFPRSFAFFLMPPHLQVLYVRFVEARVPPIE
jgi:hypothetical protein